MNQVFTQFAFTDSVKRVQEHYGSRKAYARMETSGDQYRLTERETKFIQSGIAFIWRRWAKMDGPMFNFEVVLWDFSESSTIPPSAMQTFGVTANTLVPGIFRLKTGLH
jgi:hypothetical protein